MFLEAETKTLIILCDCARLNLIFAVRTCKLVPYARHARIHNILPDGLQLLTTFFFS